MVEYRHSAHAVYDIKYHRDMGNEISIQGAARTDSGACAGLDPADMPGTGCGDRARVGVAGPHPYAVVGATAVVSGKAGAIHQGAIVAAVAGGIPGTGQAVLGAALVGTGIFLRDGGCGG